MKGLFWVVVALAVAHLGWLGFGGLPDEMVVQWGFDGRPTRRAPASELVWVHAAVTSLLAVSIAVLPRLYRVLDPAFVNIPNRTYWFAPERRDATIDWLTRWTFGLGAGTVALSSGVAHLVVVGNQTGQRSQTAVVAVLGGLVVISVVIPATVFWRFRLPHEVS